MPYIDRLSSLVSHFEIRTSLLDDPALANLLITGNSASPQRLFLNLNSEATHYSKIDVLAAIRINFGGQANPVMDAMPEVISVDLPQSMDLTAIARLIISEINPQRCGGQYALDRLCEFLVVNLLRNQIEYGNTESGVLAGLAHPNLSTPIVAIHNEPGRVWRLDDLVGLSGMSRSLFMKEFHTVIGKSPMAYLKQWRMALARNALLKGERVKETARKFGYGSGDAFTRAFTNAYGLPPTRIQDTV
ncbi:MAG: AraC family transcriptional regulator [Rhizobiaceae bacterium]